MCGPPSSGPRRGRLKPATTSAKDDRHGQREQSDSGRQSRTRRRAALHAGRRARSRSSASRPPRCGTTRPASGRKAPSGTRRSLGQAGRVADRVPDKGKQIYVEGRLQTAASGTTRTATSAYSAPKMRGDRGRPARRRRRRRRAPAARRTRGGDRLRRRAGASRGARSCPSRSPTTIFPSEIADSIAGLQLNRRLVDRNLLCNLKSPIQISICNLTLQFQLL